MSRDPSDYDGSDVATELHRLVQVGLRKNRGTLIVAASKTADVNEVFTIVTHDGRLFTVSIDERSVPGGM